MFKFYRSERNIEKLTKKYLSKYGEVSKLDNSKLDDFYSDFTKYTCNLVEERDDLVYGKLFAGKVINYLPGEFKENLGLKVDCFLREKMNNKKSNDGINLETAVHLAIFFECCKNLFEETSKMINFEGKGN